MQATQQVSTAEEELRIEVPGGQLQGTLEQPDSLGPWPMALIIAGSGPTDRNGNSLGLPGQNNSLAMLAKGLAAQGVASLRYDKRGVGASADARIADEEMHFETLVDDAASWLRWIEADQRFSGLGIIGHSEGSLIGMLAAGQAQINAYVSLEGAGVPAQELLARQLADQLPEPLLNIAREVIARLAAGHRVNPLPDEMSQLPPLAALFRPSLQPYLISWFQYDPAAVLARLCVPVLVVQGTTDLQVGVDDLKRLGGANPRAHVALIEGMNHVLKAAPLDRQANLATYSDPSRPLHTALVATILAFLKRALGSQPQSWCPSQGGVHGESSGYTVMSGPEGARPTSG
jgi:pimeloyl-ACP methyl ester carboxylesterase